MNQLLNVYHEYFEAKLGLNRIQFYEYEYKLEKLERPRSEIPPAA